MRGTPARSVCRRQGHMGHQKQGGRAAGGSGAAAGRAGVHAAAAPASEQCGQPCATSGARVHGAALPVRGFERVRHHVKCVRADWARRPRANLHG
eukprot:100385-Chlamydomonas_euryale.AAC.4